MGLSIGIRVGFLPTKTRFCQTLNFNRIKPVKNRKNQNAGITGWCEEFLFTVAAVYYSKRALCLISIISHQTLGNSGLCWTIFAWNRDTAVAAEGNGDLQTLICVLVRRCLTLSNPVPWQNWMVAYLGYTLRMKTLFRGWPVMVHYTHTMRRRWFPTKKLTPMWQSILFKILQMLHSKLKLHTFNYSRPVNGDRTLLVFYKNKEKV